MRLGFLFVMTAIPFLEIALMIKVGQYIGFWQTVMLICLSMVGGTYIIYEQGLVGLQRSIDAMSRGRTAAGPLLDGAFIIFAGFLLIIPGFLTDIIGLVLLVPPVRRRCARWCVRYLLGAETSWSGRQKDAEATNSRQQEPWPRPADRSDPKRQDGPVIDGEFHHVGDKTVDPRRAKAPPNGKN
jgi:UPF0716 protein FxsA